MKISERKKRLRDHGIVPVPQTPMTQVAKKSLAARPAPQTEKSSRPRTGGAWPFGSTGQIVIGAIYVIAAPLMLQSYLIFLGPHHHGKAPGIIELIAPPLFFLFGLWQIRHGLRARRQNNPSTKAQKGPRKTKERL